MARLEVSGMGHRLQRAVLRPRSRDPRILTTAALSSWLASVSTIPGGGMVPSLEEISTYGGRAPLSLPTGTGPIECTVRETASSLKSTMYLLSLIFGGEGGK